MGDVSSIPGPGRSPEEGNGNLIQYSCPENSTEQRSLAGDNPWGATELGHKWATNKASKELPWALNLSTRFVSQFICHTSM